MQYHFELVDGHIIISKQQEVFLLDIGSPKTFSTLSCIEWDGQQKEVNIASGMVEQVNRYVNTTITTLLGNDILKTSPFTIDYKNKIITTGENIEPFDFEETLDFYNSIPVLTFSINQRPHKLFLDTGAVISYLTSSILTDQHAYDTGDDFYIGFGNFQTPLYKLQVQLNSIDETITFGKLPQQLERQLLRQIDGIIGFDLFKQFKIYFDLSNKIIKFKRG